MGYVPRRPSETPEIIIARLRKYRILIGCLAWAAILVVVVLIVTALVLMKPL